MKKRMIICLAFCCAIMGLSGCRLFGYSSGSFTGLGGLLTKGIPIKDLPTNEEVAFEVLSFLANDNADGLKSMFCLKTQNIIDIDAQIRSGLDFFEGTVVSYNDYMGGNEETSYENGMVMLLDRGWSVNDIKTNAGKTYSIYIKINHIYEADKSREGITQIVITRDNNNDLAIGYTWPDYYQEGSAMSREIVGMFDSGDIAGLKNLFCKRTANISDIDLQIQSAFDLYQGTAIAGRVGTSRDGHELYDGKHDYHATVSDDEVVVNYEPISTFIVTHVSNIETDAGEKYEMEFYAYLLCVDDENRVGISQIRIVRSDDVERVIGGKIE